MKIYIITRDKLGIKLYHPSYKLYKLKDNSKDLDYIIDDTPYK